MALSREEVEALAATQIMEAIPPEGLAAVLSAPPFVKTRSIVNIRDIGALPGSALPAGRFYRSGALAFSASDPDATAWLSANVSRIFDLRTVKERDGAPDPVLEGVENTWLEGEGTYPAPDVSAYIEGEGAPGWKKQFMAVASVYRPAFKAALEHVRDRPTEPILFHCTAGRDRTGFLAGLLHALAGTSTDDIIHDYMLSRIGLEPAREKLTQYALAMSSSKDPNEPGFANMVGQKPEFWAALVEGLNEEYGGWDGYVTKCLGFSEEDLDKIKKNLQKE